MTPIELQGTFTLPTDSMWQKWTDPDQLISWFQPGGMYPGQIMRDLREEGRYRIRFNAPDGSEQVLLGRYQRVIPGQQLQFSWQWQDEDHSTNVMVSFSPSAGESCDLTIRHSGFNDAEDKELHEQAWLTCLERLSMSA